MPFRPSAGSDAKKSGNEVPAKRRCLLNCLIHVALGRCNFPFLLCSRPSQTPTTLHPSSGPKDLLSIFFVHLLLAIYEKSSCALLNRDEDPIESLSVHKRHTGSSLTSRVHEIREGSASPIHETAVIRVHGALPLYSAAPSDMVRCSSTISCHLLHGLVYSNLDSPTRRRGSSPFHICSSGLDVLIIAFFAFPTIVLHSFIYCSFKQANMQYTLVLAAAALAQAHEHLHGRFHGYHQKRDEVTVTDVIITTVTEYVTAGAIPTTQAEIASSSFVSIAAPSSSTESSATTESSVYSSAAAHVPATSSTSSSSSEYYVPTTSATSSAISSATSVYSSSSVVSSSSTTASSAASSAASSSSDSTSSGESNSGQATFYGGNVAGGDCSFSTYTLPSGMYGTALSSSNWNTSANCGGCVSVSYGGKSITAMVSKGNFNLQLRRILLTKLPRSSTSARAAARTISTSSQTPFPPLQARVSASST
jgi:hypothetical protein